MLKTLIQKIGKTSIYLVILLAIQVDILISVLNPHLALNVFFRIGLIFISAIFFYIITFLFVGVIWLVVNRAQKMFFKGENDTSALSIVLLLFFFISNYMFTTNIFTINQAYTTHATIWNFTPAPVTFKINLLIILISAISSILFTILILFIRNNNYKILKSFKNWKFIGIAWVLCFIIITLSIPHKSASKQESLPKEVNRYATNKDKIILVYMESLTMDMIMKKALNGELPAFTRLMKEGAWGEINTVFPSFSPVVSTSVITGMLPENHKILSYTSMKLPFTNKPLLAIPSKYGYRSAIRLMKRLNMRKCPPVNYKSIATNTLWDILDLYNCGIANVGWCASWPAKEFKNGINITDRFEVEGYDKTEYSDSSMGRLGNTDYLDNFKLSTFIDTNYTLGSRDNYKMKDTMHIFHGYEDPINVIDNALNRDKRFMNISLDYIKNSSLDLYTVFLPGLDIIEHGFWEFMAPKEVEDSAYRVDPNGQEIFKNTIRNYYKLYDSYIYNILESIDSNTTLIALSGHGMKPGITYEDGKISADHRYDDTKGVGFLYGNGIKPGYNFGELSVLDIAPSILILLGLPISDQMNGAVASSTMESNYLYRNFPKCIDSYRKFSPKKIELTEPPIQSRTDLYKIHLYD